MVEELTFPKDHTNETALIDVLVKFTNNGAQPVFLSTVKEATGTCARSIFAVNKIKIKKRKGITFNLGKLAIRLFQDV